MIVEKWKQVDARITGSSHSEHNEVCQDRTYALNRNQVYVVSLSDGAGSKKYSHIGAEIATKKICELVVDHFDEYMLLLEKNGVDHNQFEKQIDELKRKIIEPIAKDLSAYAIKENIAYTDLSCTLLFFAYKNDHYIQGHIGDGAIGIVYGSHESRHVEISSKPENGSQPNITFFITDQDVYEHMRLAGGKTHNINGVILMSDGPSELLYDKTYGFNKNTIKLFDNFNYVEPSSYKKSLEGFLANTVAKVSDDDLSLNILYKEVILQSKIEESYMGFLLGDIVSSEQVIQISHHGIYLNPQIKKGKKEFSSVSQVKEYLGWT